MKVTFNLTLEFDHRSDTDTESHINNVLYHLAGSVIEVEEGDRDMFEHSPHPRTQAKWHASFD